jgi:glycosyltransferase involved in cell wall biosynthesis
MKVLHVIPSVSMTQGGPSRAIVDIERALSARGMEVTTVTTDDDGDDARLDMPLGTPLAEDNATRLYFAKTTTFYKVSLGLGAWLRRNIASFDVVHAHALFSFAPLAAATLARRSGVPYVLRPLGALASYGMTRRRPMMKGLSLDLVERPLLEAASAVHFTSQDELADAETLGIRCKGVVIPLGVDVGAAPQRATPSADSLSLLFLSRIDPVKNLEGLLEALSILVKRRAGVVLRIAGDGDPAYVARLKAMTSQLGLAQHVEWLGRIHGLEKARALARADAFVQPSFSESFGIAVVEALAAGLPCVVSDRVAIHDDVRRAAAGVVTGVDAESIAAGVEYVMAGSRKTMSEASRRLALDSFSLEAMGARLEMLYREIATPSEKAAAA